MLDTFKELIANQYEATFCTLNACIERCPEESWDAPIVNLKFCQVAFHTLFYADLYLGQNVESIRDQTFHSDNPDYFRDYEELQDREQELLYDRPTTKNYLAHCRTKASNVIAAETEEVFKGPSGFERRTISRAELHVYNIRHIYHHAAQLGLWLNTNKNEAIPWFGSGWRDE